MKAALYDRYGPPQVLELRDLPEPTPARGQIKVRVGAASVNPKDALIRAGKFRRLTGSKFPKLVGSDFAGTVVGLGPGVSGFTVGDLVFGMLNGFRAGACAEYVLAGVGEVALMPRELGFVDAAALPLAGQTALQALRDLAAVKNGSQVCIHGASGGVGTLAVQIAAAQGARVTALCGTDSGKLVSALGAETVLDYHLVQPPRIEGRFERTSRSAAPPRTRREAGWHGETPSPPPCRESVLSSGPSREAAPGGEPPALDGMSVEGNFDKVNKPRS